MQFISHLSHKFWRQLREKGRERAKERKRDQRERESFEGVLLLASKSSIPHFAQLNGKWNVAAGCKGGLEMSLALCKKEKP